MKILLMEDELHLRNNIKKFLSIKGHDVDAFENGEEVLSNSNPHDYDCMILDINTPEVDGFELLEYIRNKNITTPALYISALTDVDKILKAFELGAGDYLKKPFDLAELEIRMIHVCFQNAKGNIINIDDTFSYDMNKRSLLKHVSEVKLSAKQKKILYLLLKNQNSIVTFDMLIEYVWDGKDISHGTILSTMRNLKSVFKDNVIQNVKGEGYIFTTNN